MKKCKCGLYIWNYETALKRLPRFLVDGLDVLGQHKTVSDLKFMAETQLDFYYEGEDSDIKTPRQEQTAIRYVKTLEHSLNPCQ
jgi:hypothetical protein